MATDSHGLTRTNHLPNRQMIYCHRCAISNYAPQGIMEFVLRFAKQTVLNLCQSV
jgi:hypothetical protein